MPQLKAFLPFDFRLTLAFLNGFTPMQGEQQLAGELRKATRQSGQTVGFVVRQEGENLNCDFFPERPLEPAEEQDLLERISFFLALEVDLSPFYRLAAHDQPFKPVLNTLYGFHQPRFLTPFEVACWAVIHQRLPLAYARKIKKSLAEQFGGEWKGLNAFPEPCDMAQLTTKDFLNFVPNERKARALVEVTAAFQGVTTQELSRKPYAEVRNWLRGIYGIGEWSALFILVRGLGRGENIQVQDKESAFLKELLKAARPIYGELTSRQLWELAEQYGDQQGQWAIYLRSLAAVTP